MPHAVRWLPAAGALALCLAGPVQVVAQTGTAEGRVLERSGRWLPDADIRVSDGGGNLLGHAASDRNGTWRISGVPPGRHQLAVRRVGYRPWSGPIEVVADQVAVVTVTLDAVPRSIDSLVVTAPAIRITVEDTEIRNRLTVRELTLLPTAFDTRELTGITPGTRPGHLWGGASDQANDYRLDGATVRDPGRGGAAFLPSVSWIESIEVRGLGAGAEQGGFQGGQVDIVTRSGSNTPAGALRTVVESSRLNASNLVAGEIGSELGSRFELDGQLRGPVLRDRLYYAAFGHYIATGERVLDQLTAVPGGTISPAPSEREGRGLLKLSWYPSASDQVVATAGGRMVDGDRTGQRGFTTQAATEQLRHRTGVFTVTWQRTWSPASVVDLRVGGLAARTEQTAYQGGDVPGIQTLVLVDPSGYQNAALETTSAPASLDLGATWTLRGRLGSVGHELRIGGEWVAGEWDYDQRRTGGMTWRPYPKADLDPANPSTWPTTGAINTTWGGEVGIRSRVTNSAVFLQEYLQLTSRLRLTPGIRMGWWSGTITSMRTGQQVTVSDQGLEPRVGAVLQLDREGSFVARAHWGRYHQPMFASLFDRVEGAGAYSDEERWSYTGPAFSDPTTRFSRPDRDALAQQGRFALEEVVELAQEGRVEGYRQPYADQALIGLERSFGPRWKAGLAWVWRRNRNLVALVDRNLESNYTVYEDVRILDRFFRPLSRNGQEVVLDRLGVSNRDIIYWWNLVKSGAATGEVLPPGLTPAQMDALRYEPDLVYTVVPEADRRFRQLQATVEARYPGWWVTGGLTITTLEGNFNVVTGPDDFTNGGPGPWVRLNEQYNAYGNLRNQGAVEVRLHAGGLLPAGFRGGSLVSWISGDRSTPTLTLSSLLLEARVPGPTPAGLPLRWWFFRGVDGHRMFLEPRGEFRLPARARVDLHLERSLPVRRAELLATVDLYNALGARAVLATETAVNAIIPPFGNAYGTVRGRVPPRTLRLGLGVRF